VVIKTNFVYLICNKLIIKKENVMSKFRELRLNPPKLTIKEGAREVIFKTIDAMCDNVHYITFKKNEEGDFERDVSVDRIYNLNNSLIIEEENPKIKINDSAKKNVLNSLINFDGPSKR
jgi:hypothetical protein